MKPLCVCIASLLITCIPVSFALADGGALYVSPENGSYTIGDTFDVQVLADSGGAAINAAEASITFDANALEVLSIKTNGSILSSWPSSPEYSNDNGTIDFSGIASQKYSGSNGLLITITFKALQNLQSPVHFESGALLAADGMESNIITTLRSGLYVVQPTEIPAPAPSDTSATSSTDSSQTNGDTTPASDIAPPVLLHYQTAISVGDRIVVQGSAPPNATVSVWLKAGGNDPTRTDMDADSNGSFTYVSDTQAQPGIYEIWAVTQGPAGAVSSRSNKIDITAIPAGSASVALVSASIATNLIPFSALMIFAILAVAYLFHRHKLEKYRIEQQHKNTSA